MQFDFWNNPLVVTAMRLKYRRGSPGMRAAIWVLILLGIGALVHHLSQLQNFRFPTAYLLVILSVQCLASAAIAVSTTASSMNAEVVSRTLDFQRIVTLTPREILVGKMIGEPALSYFIMLASIPLAALCWGLGAASWSVIVLFYINILTFTLMWAAVGVIHSLQPPTQVAGRERGGGSIGMVLLFAVLPQVLIHGARVIDKPGAGDVMQLLTPMGSLIHLWRDDPWLSQISLWGVSIPSLIAAPIAQLAIAAWIVAAMSRRLKNLLDPTVTKRRAYATIAVLDVLIAGICYSRWREGYDATQIVYAFGLAHIAVCFLLMFFVVPRNPALVAWIWRRDRRKSAVKEALFGDRSEVAAATVILALIGLAVLMLGLVLPIEMAAGAVNSRIDPARLAEVAAATAAVVVGVGITQQLCVAASPRGGMMLFMLFVALANVAPPVATALLEASGNAPPNVETFAALSPVAMFVMNITSVANRQISAVPAIGLYAGLAVLSYALLRRWLRNQTATVERKLQGMALG